MNFLADLIQFVFVANTRPRKTNFISSLILEVEDIRLISSVWRIPSNFHEFKVSLANILTGHKNLLRERSAPL